MKNLDRAWILFHLLSDILSRQLVPSLWLLVCTNIPQVCVSSKKQTTTIGLQSETCPNVEEKLSSNLLLPTGKLPIRLHSSKLSRWEPDQWKRRSQPGHLILPLTLVTDSCSGELGGGRNTHHDQTVPKLASILLSSNQYTYS